KVDGERELLEAFAKRLSSQLIYFVPRDNIVQHAEINKKVVIEYQSDCQQANAYRGLAEAVDSNDLFVIPTPMQQEELEELMMEHGLMGL
ncbi:MAG: hypothetical protein LBU07_06075, partial [Coriobacteriales bacterium]|nr:hypothetical protein [Coriobacteriales bacterium]